MMLWLRELIAWRHGKTHCPSCDGKKRRVWAVYQLGPSLSKVLLTCGHTKTIYTVGGKP